MDDQVRSDSASMTVGNYEAVAFARSGLKSRKVTATDLVPDKAMTAAWVKSFAKYMYQEHLAETRRKAAVKEKAQAECQGS